MNVLVVTEYYPRTGDPVRGIWVHRQALAARQAGAAVKVVVLHRPVPTLEALRARNLGAIRREVSQPAHDELDGLQVEYLRYVSPPRAWSYGSWGAWAAHPLARRLRGSTFDLVHAHYAVPAGDAVRRAAPDAPLVVSVHGHDVHGDGTRMPAVGATLAHSDLVLANSAGTAERCAAHGARHTHVVHLGTDVPAAISPPPPLPTLVSVGHLVARKRHADVIAALATLRRRHPDIRYVVVGDGPERGALQSQAASLGVADAVEFRGALPHAEALAVARSGSLFVMPSLDEAFGVAYIEAMAGGVPTIGCTGEDGPAEIAFAGPGMTLVPPCDPAALAETINRLLTSDESLRAQARQTVAESFTWEQCGQATLAAYAQVLR